MVLLTRAPDRAQAEMTSILEDVRIWKDEAGMNPALATTRAGAFEGDILAAMQGAVFQGGGRYAGNKFIIGSGDHALLCRYHSGPRYLDKKDQMTLEWAGLRSTASTPAAIPWVRLTRPYG